MTPTQAQTKRILIATASPLDGQAIEAMLRDARLGMARVTNDSREIGPLYEKWPYRVLVLDTQIGPRSALDVLGDLANPIETGALSAVAIIPDNSDTTLARVAADMGVDVIHRPFARADMAMRVRWALNTRTSVKTLD